MLFSAPGPENDVVLSQPLALPPKLPARGSWLRAPGIGAGCLPGLCIWVGGQRHLGAVISLLMWLKQSYKSNEDIFSLQIEGLLSDRPTAGVH